MYTEYDQKGREYDVPDDEYDYQSNKDWYDHQDYNSSSNDNMKGPVYKFVPNILQQTNSALNGNWGKSALLGLGLSLGQEGTNFWANSLNLEADSMKKMSFLYFQSDTQGAGGSFSTAANEIRGRAGLLNISSKTFFALSLGVSALDVASQKSGFGATMATIKNGAAIIGGFLAGVGASALVEVPTLGAGTPAVPIAAAGAGTLVSTAISEGFSLLGRQFNIEGW